MFSKLFALILLAVVTYVLLVFASPHTVDTYGWKPWNESLRTWKASLDQIGMSTSASGATGSMIEQFKGKVAPLIDDTTQTIEQVQTTIETKTEQVKTAIDSVSGAYASVKKAQSDISVALDMSGQLSSSGSR